MINHGPSSPGSTPCLGLQSQMQLHSNTLRRMRSMAVDWEGITASALTSATIEPCITTSCSTFRLLHHVSLDVTVEPLGTARACRGNTAWRGSFYRG